MGVIERRDRDKERRRNDIVDAAERVFFSKGWNESTMDDVAAAAELGKATLYLYFRSKEDLYAAILLRGSRIMHAMFEREVSARDTGVARVEAIGRAYIEFARRYPDHFGAMLHFGAKSQRSGAMTPCERECEEVGGRSIALVAAAVQAGIDDRTIRAGLDPVRTAVILWAQTTGLLQILSVKGARLESNHGVSSDDLVERFFEFVALALRPS